MKFNWRKLKNIVCWKELTRTAGHALCAGWYRALKCVDWLPKVRFSCAASLFLVNFHLSTVPPAKPAHFHVAHNIALPSKLNVSSFEFKLWIARFAKWRSWNSIVKNDFTFGSADFLKKTIETYQMKFIFCQILFGLLRSTQREQIGDNLSNCKILALRSLILVSTWYQVSDEKIWDPSFKLILISLFSHQYARDQMAELKSQRELQHHGSNRRPQGDWEITNECKIVNLLSIVFTNR